MRDLFLISAIALLCLATLRKPQVGILSWLWLSVMNPHKLSYGWITTFPLLDLVVAVTLLSAFINNKSMMKVRSHPILWMLGLFYLWTTLTTLFSVVPDQSFEDWLNFTKTLLLVLMILLFMNSRHWTIALIAVFILSIGFTGLKGGVFTVLTGGGNRVWGPPGTAWGDNNGVSVAMLMVIPITLACRQLFQDKWLKYVVSGTSASFFFCLLGTQSRGGLVGLLGMLSYLVFRSNKKIISLILTLIVLFASLLMMPDSWKDRMDSIQNPTDRSSQTRLIQWQYAIDIAGERPFFGNGFDAYKYKPYYYKYVAHLDANRNVHSNYFQVLGDQGYIGLAMYLIIGVSLVQVAHRHSKRVSHRRDLKWEKGALAAIQFSIVGFAFNGLTVNMAYLDLYYYLLTFVMLLSSQIRTQLERELPPPLVDGRFTPPDKPLAHRKEPMKVGPPQ